MRRFCLLAAVCAAVVPFAWAQSGNPTTSSGNGPGLGPFVVYLGGGFAPPIATTHKRLKTGWNAIAGFGPRLGGGFELPLDFAFQRYSAKDSLQPSGQAPIGGNMRMWSLTLNPTYEVATSDGGIYFTVGGGLYNRRFQITQATLVNGTFCDPFWGFCSPVVTSATVVLGSQSVYKGGWNVGTGFTFGPEHITHLKFFAEVRYHYMYTSPVRTETLPITFGIRW